jgi:hypothetical protein
MLIPTKAFRFDSIGIAGFGHDFKALEGHKSPTFEAFNRLSNVQDSAAMLLYMVAGLFIPQVVNIPTEPARFLKNMKKNFSDIAEKLIEDSQRSEDASETMGHRSIIGLLRACLLYNDHELKAHFPQ